MTETEKKGRKVKIIKPQPGFQEMFLASEADITLGGGAAGAGKMAPYTEPTLTPNGWKPMGSIVEGSEIICPVSGDPKKVLKTFHHKNLNIYKVEFNDGTSTECCEDHLWKVQTKKQISNGNHSVIPLSEIISRGVKDNRGGNRFAINCNAPINFKYKPVRLNPYLLGLLLGDGYFPTKTESQVEMQVNLAESESLFSFIKSYIPSDVEIKLRKKYEANCRRIGFTKNIKSYLGELGLLGKKSGEKFVPKSYLYNSVEIRKDILAGLVDTDSYIQVIGGKKKKTAFTTTSSQLKDDFCELVRSLGGLAFVSLDKRDKYKDGVCYKVSYRTPFNPFKRDRRKVLFNQVDYKFNFNKKITSIEYVGRKDGQCILVDSKDHMYITNGYNATHNTFALALEPLYDIHNPNFLAIFFRRRSTELGPVLMECERRYLQVKPRPEYTSSNMEWKFPSGAKVLFNHLQHEKDKHNHQGWEYSLICFDELTHFSFGQFKYLLSRNRSVSGARSRIKATCNPDPDSWVAKLIDWWIGEDGLPIPERSGKLRYFLAVGEKVSDYIWGDSFEEVKEKGQHILDRAMADSDSELVTEKDLIKSITFIPGSLKENKELLKKDPGYVGSLMAQGEADRKRLLEGNWKFRHQGDELVGIDAINEMFDRLPNRSSIRRAITADVAGKGSDNMVVMAWEGFHLIDIAVVARSNGKQIVDALIHMQRKWNIQNRDVVFDANGVGSHIDGYIPNALEYKSQDTSRVKNTNYKDLKAMCCINWADRINGTLPESNKTKHLNYSIASNVADRIISGKTLQEHLTEERKAIRLAPASVDGKIQIIKKSEMIAILGHSPDFVESMLMLEFLYLSFNKSKINILW